MDSAVLKIVSIQSKLCKCCGKSKPFSKFVKIKGRKNSYTVNCKKCRNKAYKDPRKNRKDRLPAMYGVTYDYVVRVLESQRGLCANQGCGKEISLATHSGAANRAVIDHDHKTGKFRAVLCSVCNMLLGKIENDQNQVFGLLEYIDKHEPSKKD